MVPNKNLSGAVFMQTITVKKIPPDLYKKLKQLAKENRRSINSEIIVCIERAICSQRINSDAFLKRIEQLQKGLDLPSIAQSGLEKALDEGRS
jgi:hypothetical protein